MNLKKLNCVFLILVLLLGITPLFVSASEKIIPFSESSGVLKSGKKNSISSSDEFLKFEALGNSCNGATIVLEDDIVINRGVFSVNDENEPLYNEKAILNHSNIIETEPIEAFGGIFDGQGHTISGVYIASDSAAGLFKTCSEATIKNLTVKNSLIVGGQNVGSICGSAYKTEVQDCVSEAIVIGGSEVGGIAGAFDGDIGSCFFKGTVVGKTKVGGVAGSIKGGSMYQSGNSGTVYADDLCGGFAGEFCDGSIISCFNTGDIYGGSVGGFIGLISLNRRATAYYIPNSVINSCYAAGKITSEKYGDFCYSSYGDFSLFGGCYFKGESANTADYGGNLQKDYDSFVDSVATSEDAQMVPSFYMFAVDENALKLSEHKYLTFGCWDFVEDKGNENKGFMLPISLHKAHVWGDYAYNNDATCIKGGTKTARCTAFGCDKKNTVSDADHPKTEHDFEEYVLDENGLTETARCRNRGCNETNTIEHKHIWGEYVYNGDAKCEKDGTMTANCTKTGCNIRNTIADSEHKATGHNFSEWKSNHDAKLFANGTESRSCDRCGLIQTHVADDSAIIVVIFKKIMDVVIGWFE